MLLFLGWITAVAGTWMLLLAAMRVGPRWLLGCLFLVAWPVFRYIHFTRAWKPLTVFAAGILLQEMGVLLGRG